MACQIELQFDTVLFKSNGALLHYKFLIFEWAQLSVSFDRVSFNMSFKIPRYPNCICRKISQKITEVNNYYYYYVIVAT